MTDKARCLGKFIVEPGESEYHWEEAKAYRDIAEATKGIVPEFSAKANWIADEEEFMAHKLSDWKKELRYL